jgi:hypothetical protein
LVPGASLGPLGAVPCRPPDPGPTPRPPWASFSYKHYTHNTTSHFTQPSKVSTMPTLFIDAAQQEQLAPPPLRLCSACSFSPAVSRLHSQVLRVLSQARAATCTLSARRPRALGPWRFAWAFGRSAVRSPLLPGSNSACPLAARVQLGVFITTVASRASHR